MADLIDEIRRTLDGTNYEIVKKNGNGSMTRDERTKWAIAALNAINKLGTQDKKESLELAIKMLTKN